MFVSHRSVATVKSLVISQGPAWITLFVVYVPAVTSPSIVIVQARASASKSLVTTFRWSAPCAMAAHAADSSDCPARKQFIQQHDGWARLSGPLLSIHSTDREIWQYRIVVGILASFESFIGLTHYNPLRNLDRTPWVSTCHLANVENKELNGCSPVM